MFTDNKHWRDVLTSFHTTYIEIFCRMKDYAGCMGGICRGDGGYVLVTGCRGMALNCLFCVDVIRPLDLVPLTDFTYKYNPVYNV